LAQLQYEGLIPPPGLLAQFGEIIPDAPERILQMAERQEAHRQRMEWENLRGSQRRSWGGLVCGFIVAVVGLLVAGDAALHEQPVAASIIGSIDIVGLVSVFVYGQRSQREERSERARIMAGQPRG